jgi:hypothetical protein
MVFLLAETTTKKKKSGQADRHQNQSILPEQKTTAHTHIPRGKNNKTKTKIKTGASIPRETQEDAPETWKEDSVFSKIAHKSPTSEGVLRSS